MDLDPSIVIPFLGILMVCIFVIVIMYIICQSCCGRSRVDNGGFDEVRSDKNTRVGKVYYTQRPNISRPNMHSHRPNMHQNTHHGYRTSKSRNYYDDDCNVYNPTTMNMTNFQTGIPMYQDDFNSSYNHGHHGSSGHHYSSHDSGGHHGSSSHHYSSHDSGGHHGSSGHHDTSSSYDCGGGGGGGGFDSGGGGGGGCDSGGGGGGGCDGGGGGGGGCD